MWNSRLNGDPPPWLAVAFLLSRDPAATDCSYAERISAAWFKLGVPLRYWSDVLETAEMLVCVTHNPERR